MSKPIKTTISVLCQDRFSRNETFKIYEYTTEGLAYNFNVAVIRAWDPLLKFHHKKRRWSIIHINSGRSIAYSSTKPGAMFLAERLQHVDFDTVRQERFVGLAKKRAAIKQALVNTLEEGRKQGYKYSLSYLEKES